MQFKILSKFIVGGIMGTGLEYRGTKNRDTNKVVMSVKTNDSELCLRNNITHVRKGDAQRIF